MVWEPGYFDLIKDNIPGLCENNSPTCPDVLTGSQVPYLWSRPIRGLREKHGLSQEELAAGAGISLQSLELIETAQMELDADTLMRILYFLGYELEAMSREGRKRHRRQLLAANNPDEVSKAAARALFDLQW